MCVWNVCVCGIVKHTSMAFCTLILPMQVSFSLRNPDLHSVQFPAPGPEHVCLQDKWHAGRGVGAKLFETFSNLLASFPVPHPAFRHLQYPALSYCKRQKAGRGNGNEAKNSQLHG